MLDPLPDAAQLLEAVSEAMRQAGQQTLIVGIDGRPGSGKSSVAAWLGWQLSVPVLALELFVVADSDPVEWRYEDLGRALSTMTRRAVIVEGVCLCEALQALDRDPDYLVWTDNQGGPEHGPEEPTDDYVQAFDPAGNADFTLRWSQVEPVMVAG